MINNNCPKKSVIDIGSNSVRLYVTSAESSTKYVETTMLAHGFENGQLDIQSIQRTVAAISLFIEKATSMGYPKPVIFATEALRAAKNKDVFLSELKKLTPLNVDILSANEEANIAFLGAAAGINEPVGIIDIGGASVEYAYGNYGKVIYKKSLPLGAITLKRLCGDDRNELYNYITAKLTDVDNSYNQIKLIGIGGTLTTLASMDLGQQIYDPTTVHNHKLTKKNLLELEKIVYSDTSLLDTFKTLKPKRAEILKQGILLALAYLDHLACEEIIVSEMDNLEGYLIYKGY